MYSTRAAKITEIVEMKRSYPSPMGHIVTGYSIGENGTLQNSIETMSEIQAALTPGVVAIRRKMPNGRFIYRVILSKEGV